MNRFEIVLTDTFDTEDMSRRILTCGLFDIDITATETGIIIEVHKFDNVVAELSVDA